MLKFTWKAFVFLLIVDVVRLGGFAEEISPEVMALGESVYLRPGLCSTCHMPDGKGNALIPPLAGSTFWVMGDPSNLINVVHYGVQGPIKVYGAIYDSAMPAQGGMLSTEELAAVLTYVRNSWGNRAGAISVEDIQAIVAETGERGEPWTVRELLKQGGPKPPFEYLPETLLTPAEDRAVIYRNFLKGGSKRSIGIGFPNGVNAAFDADLMQVSNLWRGDFINAGRNWDRRGGGITPPAGEDIVSLRRKRPFAALDSPNTDWPEYEKWDDPYDFSGYELDEQRNPTFAYQYGNVQVTDRLMSRKAGASSIVSRRLMLRSAEEVEGLYFLAAVGREIRKIDRLRFRIDGDFEIGFEAWSGAEPMIRQAGEYQELVLPVSGNGEATLINQYYKW